MTAIKLKILKSPEWYYGAIKQLRKDLREEIKPGAQLELNL